MTLIVSLPPPNVARLRFTTASGSVAEAIRFDTEGAVSHVEAVLFDGIIGAYLEFGVARKALNYDTESTMQIMVDLPMHQDMYATWRSFLNSRLGWPYDLAGIAGLAIHDLNMHEKGALFCSALQMDALAHALWWSRPLALPYHAVTPVVLLLMLQADERTIIHNIERIKSAG